MLEDLGPSQASASRLPNGKHSAQQLLDATKLQQRREISREQRAQKIYQMQANLGNAALSGRAEEEPERRLRDGQGKAGTSHLP